MTEFAHSSSFRLRRFLNWFPLGIAYASLYMGRYNLTVAKTQLSVLMTKEDFGAIFGAGTLIYACALLINAPLVDRLGGRFGMLMAISGSAIANLLMAGYLYLVQNGSAEGLPSLRLTFIILYVLNMYFQNFGALSIVKVNSSWFHLRERGGFSGIFGTMISSGLFLAFTVNGWILEMVKPPQGSPARTWVVFLAPALLLLVIYLVEFFLLKNRPSEAGHQDFDLADASSGEDKTPLKLFELYKRVLTHPIIMTIALAEFCTGVLRNGVMQWFPIYAREVWVLPPSHWLVNGSWQMPGLTYLCLAVSLVSGILAKKAAGQRRLTLVTLAIFAFVAPFFQAGWGGLLFIAGVIGGNVAGWVSDLFFQSRRAPSAGFLYALLILCAIGMGFALSPPSNQIDWTKEGTELEPHDRIIQVAGVDVQNGWPQVARAFACVPPVCKNSNWNPEKCVCESEAAPFLGPTSQGKIPVVVERSGVKFEINLKDPFPTQRAGDVRMVPAGPELPLSPLWLGVLMFLLSLCVIGSHGILAGTASMDFGGKATATAVGVIDGFVYLGTSVQAVALGSLTTRDWKYWPLFLIPFACVGFLLLLRIWNAKPGSQAPAAH